LNKQLLPIGTKIKFVKLVEVEYPGNLQAGNQNTNEFSQILEEFRAGEGELQTDSKRFCEKFALGKGKIRENSRLGTGTPTSFQRSWKNSGLGKGSYTNRSKKDSVRSSRRGKGISGKTPGFIMETYFRLGRIWSVTSRLGSGKGTGTYFTVSV
jgi:hypothetical protein